MTQCQPPAQTGISEEHASVNHQSANPDEVISLQGVRFSWPAANEDTLNIPGFRVQKGEHVFVQGASGSGKSTLLNLLGGVLVPRQGEVSILGTQLNELSSSQRDSFRADHVGFIFQMFNLVPYLSLLDNIILPCRFSTLRRTRASEQRSLHDEAARLLQQLELDPLRLGRRSVNELSVGQQQRVAVARALIGRPSLLIADEPTSALDAETRMAFLQLMFEEVERTHATVVFVSHDPAIQSAFQRTVKLDDINQAAVGRRQQ